MTTISILLCLQIIVIACLLLLLLGFNFKLLGTVALILISTQASSFDAIQQSLFKRNVDVIRSEFYKLHPSAEVNDIPISLKNLDVGIAGVCYYGIFGIRWIDVNTSTWERIKTNYTQIRLLVFHELAHCTLDYPHITGHFALISGEDFILCPKSVMNTNMMPDDQADRCYNAFRKEYDEALISNIPVDKVLEK